MDEKYYRAKFVELGLSDRFDFVGRDYSSYKGRKVFIRCKECGAEFATWTFVEIIKGRQSRLLCPKCGASSDGADVWARSPRCDEAMAYYVQGHTVTETAKRFNITTAQINNAVKIRGLTNGKDWLEARVEQQKEEAENRLANRLDSIGFDYLGGYDDNKVKIRCRKCGDVFERTVSFARSGNVICKKCEHERALIRQAEQRKKQMTESAKRQAIRNAEKLAMNPLGLSQYELDREKKLDEVFVCKVCGKEYTPRQYMTSEGLTLFSNVGYCSHECKRKAMNRLSKENKKARGVQDNHRHRAIKYGCAYDSSVTLKKLIKRDGLRCAICGEMCDPNDRGWSEHMGPMSPTIDHIIPMAKSGGHTWDNVQVAHAICNSFKSDNTDEAV